MNSRIKRSTDDLYMRTNQLLSSFGFIKGNVKQKIQFILYGSVRLPTLGLLYQCYWCILNRVEESVRRIDGLPNKTHKIILPVL